jgi:hypothetical protein
MIAELEELSKRIDKIEQQKTDEVLTLIEILSNVTFFGEMKQESCEYAKDGQCSFFILTSEAKGKIPVVTECRVKKCREPSLHYHIELSNITCALCEVRNLQPPVLMSGSQVKQKNIRKKLVKRTKKRII